MVFEIVEEFASSFRVVRFRLMSIAASLDYLVNKIELELLGIFFQKLFGLFINLPHRLSEL
jgi:hypothetical protein